MYTYTFIYIHYLYIYIYVYTFFEPIRIKVNEHSKIIHTHRLHHSCEVYWACNFLRQRQRAQIGTPSHGTIWVDGCSCGRLSQHVTVPMMMARVMMSLMDEGWRMNLITVSTVIWYISWWWTLTADGAFVTALEATSRGSRAPRYKSCWPGETSVVGR